MKHLSLLLKTFPKKYLLSLGILLTILASLLSLFFSYLLKLLIDSALDKDYSAFFKFLTFIILFIFFDLLFVFFRSKCLGIYTENGLQMIRNRFAKKLTTMDYHALSKSHSGEFTSIGTNDIAKIRGFTLVTLPDLFRVPIMGIGALIFLFVLSWKLTLISISVIPVLVIGSSILSKPIGPISKMLQEKLGMMNTTSTDFIKGVEISKAYNLEASIYQHYQNEVDEAVDIGKNLARKRAILEAFSMVLSIIPFIVTFIFGGYLVVNKEMSIGDILAFINLLNFLTFPLSRLPVLVADAMAELVAFNRIELVLNGQDERMDGEEYSLDVNQPVIEFKEVSFTYPNENDLILDQVSFKINYKDSIAFVGPSGSGKSTLIKLILGFYDHYEGEIYIGGHELRTWNLNSLRKEISFVSQNTFLFPESIEENIRYGNRFSDRIEESAQIANSHEFIIQLKDGYQTKVGELGNTLSGGQKQRLSIARAVIKNSPLLLLDEPTSSLDNESEKLVQDALKKVTNDKTSVIIAHRLSTIKQVNKIFVLKDGKIIEEGTHDELYRLNGFYKELYKNQLEMEEKTDEE